MKPLLAATLNITDEKCLKALKFPLVVSPKLDGIRFLIDANGEAVTRSLKPIRNDWIRQHLELLPIGSDGEIGAVPEEIGDERGPDDTAAALVVPQMGLTSSSVMSKDGRPYFVAHVFDNWNSEGPIEHRMKAIHDFMEASPRYHFRAVPMQIANSIDELKSFYEAYMGAGYEGLMARSPLALYKFGRSTVKEAALLKVKLMERDEATVVGWEEEMHNSNATKRGATGGLERSSAKAGMIPKGRVGALKVTHTTYGDFKIYGFTDTLKASMWAQRDSLAGQLVTFEFFPYGMSRLDGRQPKPRFPRFISFRDPSDL